jgi:hypothetical protein
MTFGTPTPPAHGPFPALLSVDVRGYDVLADGRFVTVSLGSGEGLAGSTQGSELRVVLNWFEELKRLAATK